MQFTVGPCTPNVGVSKPCQRYILFGNGEYITYIRHQGYNKPDDISNNEVSGGFGDEESADGSKYPAMRKQAMRAMKPSDGTQIAKVKRHLI